jgi:hypothetical protein
VSVLVLGQSQVLSFGVDEVSDTEMAETAPAKKRKVVLDEDDDE